MMDLVVAKEEVTEYLLQFKQGWWWAWKAIPREYELNGLEQERIRMGKVEDQITLVHLWRSSAKSFPLLMY